MMVIKLLNITFYSARGLQEDLTLEVGLPVYPGLHAQVQDPSVFVQSAFAWQL